MLLEMGKVLNLDVRVTNTYGGSSIGKHQPT
jgi:hypothetical protein